MEEELNYLHKKLKKYQTDLEFDEIDVRVVGMGYLESFQLNDIHRSLEFSNFVHDKNGLVTIILDFKGVEN